MARLATFLSPMWNSSTAQNLESKMIIARQTNRQTDSAATMKNQTKELLFIRKPPIKNSEKIFIIIFIPGAKDKQQQLPILSGQQHEIKRPGFRRMLNV